MGVRIHFGTFSRCHKPHGIFVGNEVHSISQLPTFSGSSGIWFWCMIWALYGCQPPKNHRCPRGSHLLLADPTKTTEMEWDKTNKLIKIAHNESREISNAYRTKIMHRKTIGGFPRAILALVVVGSFANSTNHFCRWCCCGRHRRHLLCSFSNAYWNNFFVNFFSSH